MPSALRDRSESLIFCFYFRIFPTIVYSYLAMSRPLGRVEMFNEIYVFLSCILGKLIMYNSVFLLVSHVYCNCMTKVSLDYFHCISFFFFSRHARSYTTSVYETK